MDVGSDDRLDSRPDEEAGPSRDERAGQRATYRLQLNAGFTFDDAAAAADYLHELGVSHVYLSPILQAAPGSTHGYDVVDPSRVNVELGGEAGHLRLQEALSRADLGVLLDVVPNHMAITGRDNAWWWDVLENGPSSVFAAYFDVDWDPPESKLRNLVLMPILGDHYGRALDAGELGVSRDGGSFILRYFDHELPVAPRSLEGLLEEAARALHSAAPADDAVADAPARPGSSSEGPELPVAANELESIANAFGRLPPSWAIDDDSVRERHRDKEILRFRLARLCEESPEVALAIDAVVKAINGDVDRLDDLIGRQNYRVAWWRTASEELDYRRFFDVSTLAGIRVDRDVVFADSHRLVLDWLHRGVIDGLRIDHVDGLRDPAHYLERLRQAAPDAWLLVEKILEGDEQLPAQWPTEGTTGYDWLNIVGGVLIDQAGERPTLAAYRDFTGQNTDWVQIMYAAKKQVMDDVLAADVSRLTALVVTVCEGNRRERDFSRRDLRDTLCELIAGFEVYRTYVTPRSVSAFDIETVERAARTAAMRRPELDWELLSFLRDVLLLRIPGATEEELAMRFQQLSGAIMAKSVEDTAFYRYVPLTALNEVGGDPGRFGVGVDDLHRAGQANQLERPWALLATSTHDTKRSEDVRARLAVLAEVPDEWASAAARWAVLAKPHRVVDMPDPNTEWLIYQSLFGAWPLTAERLADYVEKATKEAKVLTSWVDPNQLYDESTRRFILALFEDEAFLREVTCFVARYQRAGWSNSMTQKLVTMTAPGVPDLYQGSEIWDLSLVDPDNRRPVDYDVRRRLLAQAATTTPADAWAAEEGEGLTKLMVVHRALQARTLHPEAFGPGQGGSYSPITGSGRAVSHVVAFSRGDEVVTVATRLPVGLQRRGGWGDTTLTLPPGRWKNHLGGDQSHDEQWRGTVPVGHLLTGVPVALLTKEES